MFSVNDNNGNYIHKFVCARQSATTAKKAIFRSNASNEIKALEPNKLNNKKNVNKN